MSDARRRNLFTASAVIVAGGIVACIFHFIQSSVLNRGYPWNTFLFLPALRFSDYKDVLTSARQSDPYSIWTLYFPFTYVAFRLVTWMPWLASFGLILYVSLRYLSLRVYRWLRPLTAGPRSAALATVILLGCSYPILFCIDRGNIEIILLTLVVAFLHDAEQGRPWRSLLWLIPAMCVKMYPATLLALFLRPKRYLQIAVAGMAAALITVASLGSFEHSIPVEIRHWREQLDLFRREYIIGNRAMNGTAGPWNAIKLALLTTTTSPEDRVAVLTKPTAREDVRVRIEALLRAYSLLTIALAVYVAFHVARVETDPLRQSLLLLLFMVLAPPGGADYKLIYIIVALVIALRLETARPMERVLVPLLALVLIPKKYFFLPHIITDVGYGDASIGVVINPLLMIAAASVLVVGGWSALRRLETG